MKTHDVARILMELSRIFKASPNIEINELDSYLLGNRFMLDKHQIPIGLSTLVALSRVDKQQWLSLIDEFGFRVEVRPRDASRDILGKLLKYLEVNADARKRLSETATRKTTTASPELMKALASLLKD